MNTKEKIVEKLKSEIVSRQEQLSKVELLSGLESLELECSFYGDQLDFDRLSHADTISVMKAIGAGKWNKAPSDEGKIHYTTKVGDLNVRCWNGEPPPNCKIIEVLEDVPEQIIPARTITRRKLVCQ